MKTIMFVAVVLTAAPALTCDYNPCEDGNAVNGYNYNQNYNYGYGNQGTYGSTGSTIDPYGRGDDE